MCLGESPFASLHQAQLGTIWGPICCQVSTERGSRIRDGLGVRVQLALGSDQRAVPGDLPEHVDRDPCIGHPGKTGVAQIVPAQTLVSELDDDLVPMRGVAQHGR